MPEPRGKYAIIPGYGKDQDRTAHFHGFALDTRLAVRHRLPGTCFLERGSGHHYLAVLFGSGAQPSYKIADTKTAFGAVFVWAGVFLPFLARYGREESLQTWKTQRTDRYYTKYSKPACGYYSFGTAATTTPCTRKSLPTTIGRCFLFLERGFSITTSLERRNSLIVA